MKESFIIRKKYKEQIDLLNTEQKAQLLEAIFHYQTEGSPLEGIDPLVSMLLSIMIQERTKDDDLYKQKCEQNKKNGKLGGAKMGNQNARKSWENDTKQANGGKNNRKQAKQADSDSDSDSDNIKKEKQKKEKAEDAFASLTVGTYFEKLDGEVQDLYIDFLKNREEMKVKNTKQATKQHLNLLKKIGNPKLQLATLSKAISAGWRGLFELTEGEKQIILNSDPPQKKPKPDLDFSGFTRDLRGRT